MQTRGRDRERQRESEKQRKRDRDRETETERERDRERLISEYSIIKTFINLKIKLILSNPQKWNILIHLQFGTEIHILHIAF